MERYNNILDRQISKLNNIFELDNIPNNAIVKVDNPGAGECLYTAITNYLRIEFIMKKYIYKLEKNKVSNMLYLPQLTSKSSKINNGEDTIQTIGRELRKMVCDWLEINGDLDYYETGKTLKQYLLDEDAIGDKVENSFLGATGDKFTAHEFHYSNAINDDKLFPLFKNSDARGEDLTNIGCKVANVAGSFAHIIDSV